MLGNPCDARASYCQTPGLPLAAAADWGDRVDYEAAQAASACHARHADRCPCHRTHAAPQECLVGRDAAPAATLPGFDVLAAQVADRCVAFERADNPELDEHAARAELQASLGLFERWHAGAVRRACVRGGV